jgi:replicative DNA helicase
MRKYLERGLEPPHGYAPNITANNQIDWIESKIVEGIAKYGSHIVFVDHLEFIVGDGHENYSLRVGHTMRQIKGIAKKWNVCIVLMCHVKKLDRIDQLPSYNDLKESSSIAQHCDTAIMLWREAKQTKQDITITNNTIVSVQLNRRHGSTGNVTMVYENGGYVEREWREDKLSGIKAEEDFHGF